MSFYGLEIAKTGLFISSKALNVTGNNIANANTVGYTRQRLVLESIQPASLDSRFLRIGKGSTGGGVNIQDLDQIRNSFLDSEFRRENNVMQQWNTRTQSLEYIESLLNETSDNSISSTLADFFDSLHDLTTDPVNKEMRTNVQQNAIKLTETFNHYYNQFVEVQKDQNNSMKLAVDRINEMLHTIGDYNQQIYAYELGGEKANDIRDKRNLMLDELSGLVNIDYYENAQGQLVVSVDCTTLINHITVTGLDAVADQTGVVTGEPGFYSIYLEGTTTPFSYSGGELLAYKDMRDSNSVDKVGVPRIVDSLNTLARSLAKEFNAVHTTGYTIPHDGIASHNGVNFFDVPLDGTGTQDYNLVTAGNFSLSLDLLDNVFNIAASSSLIDLSAGDDQQGNNEVALKMVELASRNDIANVSNFENYLKSIIVEVALDSSYSQKIYESQQAVITNLDNRRESVSGVSIDEEMIQMVKFQHAYSAASRLITAIDEMLDVLVNRTGTIGR